MNSSEFHRDLKVNFCVLADLSPDSNSSQPGMIDEDYNLDGNMYSESSYQCIRFQPFQQNQWHILCDQNLKEL